MTVPDRLEGFARPDGGGAVANAVAHAVGLRIRELSSPPRLKTLIGRLTMQAIPVDGLNLERVPSLRPGLAPTRTSTRLSGELRRYRTSAPTQSPNYARCSTNTMPAQ